MGSYLGEVLREEFAGGQWDFGSERAGKGLRWGMDVSCGSFPTSTSCRSSPARRSLFELWQESERFHVDMGLAARFAK